MLWSYYCYVPKFSFLKKLNTKRSERWKLQQFYLFEIKFNNKSIIHAIIYCPYQMEYLLMFACVFGMLFSFRQKVSLFNSCCHCCEICIRFKEFWLIFVIEKFWILIVPKAQHQAPRTVVHLRKNFTSWNQGTAIHIVNCQMRYLKTRSGLKNDLSFS